jgi:VWFA-related protein
VTLVGALCAAGGALVLAQAPTFRARTDLVRVDVLVTDGSRPLLGLQASDFEVLDDGVMQDVELIAAQEVPVNVALALDTSGSVKGNQIAQIRSAGRLVIDALKPGDKVALVSFSAAVSVRTALTENFAAARDSLATVPEAGETALVDATYAAMVLGESTADRALVIVFSDGADTASFLSPTSVLETAKHAGAVVYAVLTDSLGDQSFLRDLSQATAGRAITVQSTDKLGATLLEILDEFRQRYVLSYAPHGVGAAGWHRLEVHVKNHRGAVVRARPGYAAGL